MGKTGSDLSDFRATGGIQWREQKRCSEQICLKTVQNVHNLSLTGYYEQDRLSLYMDGRTCVGGGSQVMIESEVRLIYFGTNQKCRRMVCVCRLH